jgi:hypothetical protein
MPALFGYLIALAVLLGSGYAGLEWLASPDAPTPTTYQHRNNKAFSAAKHSGPKKSSAVADASVTAEDPEPRTAANANDTARGEGKANDTARGQGKAEDADTGDNKAQNSSAVPTGGCMPIGLTANGEMVFPLQCRELIEHQRGPVVAAPSATRGLPARDQNDAPDSGKPNETGSNTVVSVSPTQDPPIKDASNPEPTLSNQNDETKTTNTENSGQTPIRKGSNEAASDMATGMAKTSLEIPSADDKTKKVEQARTAPKRSKLVMMTLETIEFADGHREQRLVPFKHLQRPSAQGDWYNALGLR